jgi:4-amino-4-deoxy-L-arabinose transferase-like glycosyltransferase
MLERFSRLLESRRRFALAAAAWIIGLAWIRPLAVPDEGRYTDIARWMVLSGDWLIPRLNGLPFIQKPPLYFWLEAMGIAVGGTGVLVCRWVSLAGSLVTAYAVYRFIRPRFDERAARWTVVVLVMSLFFFATAQFASLDMLVSTCITCTILLAVEAAEAQEAREKTARTRWLAAYAIAALGVLAKGLIGIVIPGLVFVLWALATRRPRAILSAIRLDGLVLFALIAVPWFVLVEQRIPGFLRYFFIHNHFERYAETGFNNPRGAWFYFAVVLLGTLPWALTLYPATRAALARSGPARDASMLGLIMALVVLGFFSIPTSKLPGYVLPCAPALAILLGPWSATFKYRRGFVLASIVIGLLAIAAALQADGLDPGRLADRLRSTIAPEDRVVFWGRYFFAVPVELDRAKPVEVIDAWDKPSAELPDSWRRELAAGREFEPASAPGVLITRGEFKESLAKNPARVWVWAHKADVHEPELNDLEIALTRGDYVVLRRPEK